MYQNAKFRAPDCAMGSLPAFDIRSKREGVKIRWMVSDLFSRPPPKIRSKKFLVLQQVLPFFHILPAAPSSRVEKGEAHVWSRPTESPGLFSTLIMEMVANPIIVSSQSHLYLYLVGHDEKGNGQEKWFEKPWFLQVENFLL